MDSNEVWKDIEGYEGSYKISNQSNILSLKWGKSKLIHGTKGSFGYIKVGLYKDGKIKLFPLHCLIAKAFLPNPQNKPNINHINGIKDDNKLSNLEWCTIAENNKHARDKGLHWVQKGETHGRAKLTNIHVKTIRDCFGTGKYTYGWLGKIFSIEHSTVRYIVKRKLWAHI